MLKYILSSSNENKIKEFKTILGNKLTIQKGKDLKEVDGNIDEVILYKSLESGKGFIVEDTILEVEGKEIVDIRYCIDKYSKKDIEAKWIVSLGYNNGEEIFIYRGSIEGNIISIDNIPDDSFGFDSYFIPKEKNKANKSLHEFNKIGLKEKYSGRKIALLNLLNNNYYSKTLISSIPIWNGKYQGV